MNVTKRIGQQATIKLSAYEQRIIERAAELCGVIAANTPASSVLYDDASTAADKLVAVGMALTFAKEKTDD